MSGFTFVLRIVADEFPIRLSAAQAVEFHRRWPNMEQVIIMAANWRVNTEPGEEEWFEELGSDELDDEDFVTDFADARIQLWIRR